MPRLRAKIVGQTRLGGGSVWEVWFWLKIVIFQKNGYFGKNFGN